MKLYFAHPVNVYGTPLEDDLIAAIGRLLDCEVECPNQPHHAEGYQHAGMSYFYDEILPGCDGCVVLPFPDGKLGRGVAGEAKWFLERGLPVHIVGTIPLICARDLTEFEAEHLLSLDSLLVLSVDETRQRIRRADGSTRPFEQTLQQ